VKVLPAVGSSQVTNRPARKAPVAAEHEMKILALSVKQSTLAHVQPLGGVLRPATAQMRRKQGEEPQLAAKGFIGNL
jgi:hypothetical protein